MKKTFSSFLLLCCVWSLLSCSHHSEKEEAHHGHESALDKIKKRQNEGKQEYGVSSLNHLSYEKLIAVDSVFVGDKFLIPQRTVSIRNYKCSSCHNEPLSEIQKIDPQFKKAHWDIKLKHAGPHAMNCTTCHTGDDMDNLHTITGKKVSFDHSYQVCSSCHSTQFKEWKGGAHGKRLGGWAPPRVSNSCVNCHNPHKPAFETRFPSRLNTEYIKERR